MNRSLTVHLMIGERAFDGLAYAVGWVDEVRAVMRLRLVEGRTDTEICRELGMDQGTLAVLTLEAETLLAERIPADTSTGEWHELLPLEQARERLELLRNRRKIRIHRTGGPAATGRDGMGDLKREVVPGMAPTSPYPNAWDLVPEPPDHPGAARSRRKARDLDEKIRVQSELNRRLRLGEAAPETLNRAQRRALKCRRKRNDS